MSSPRLIQTYLLDGTLEGVRIIDCESTVKAFVIPRLKLNDIKNREELSWPALYFLINSENGIAYVGESESFYHRVKNHDQNKNWWDIAIAVVSTTNELEKSDIKYLESLAVERAQAGSMQIENRVAPVRNNIHEFKLHKLQKILDDTQLLLTSLGYDILPATEKADEIWYCRTKKTDARAVFRGNQFVILAGSVIDKTVAPSWAKSWPKSLQERNEIFAKYGEDLGDSARLRENVPFKSPNHAGGFLTGRNVNAWTTFTDVDGRTMDEVIRGKHSPFAILSDRERNPA